MSFQTHFMFFSGARKVKNIYAAFYSHAIHSDDVC